MAASNFAQCFALVLKEEGGYVNDPLDPGGMTNLGVTKRAWESYVGHEVDEETMRGLTPDLVMPFYKTQYWDKNHGDDLPLGVDYAVFDFEVNSGDGRAVKVLQACCGVTQDGAIGPATLAAVQSISPIDLSAQICDNRLAFLQSLPGWAHDGHGWGNRVSFVKDISAKMAE